MRLLESNVERLKSYANNVTLVLDGFDELSYNEGDIIRIIQGKFNQNIQYIVTCRPHASQGIVLTADSEIRLKGFSESQSKAFIKMFATNRFQKEKDVDLFISKTWKEITSSVDLLEMSTNPSMLQLICLLSAQTGKIGKDRAEVFKHYTQYLLIQYHTKHHERVPYSDKLYKDALLKCGKLAMFGLKQNHLQLVFSKQEATEVAGPVIFEIGFLTELPSIDPDKVKVQFIHKSLQEYLAAFYVVNTPGDEGMLLLMEFCSTSQKLMGSQIILSFIAAMSKTMKRVIQNQIKDYISTWESNDDVDPKSRTSFLIAMLKDNKKLTFPLPAVLDIDLQVYDLVSERIINFIKSLFGQKSTIEKFLSMDYRGVKKIVIGVGQYNRLGLLVNKSFNSVEELVINYKNSWSKDDPTHLTQVITNQKPGLISITRCVNLLFNKNLITKAILMQSVQTIILTKCQISKNNCIFLLERGHHLKDLVMQECGIQIDAEIAKAVCDLPDETQVDLSGNKIVKMNTKLLASLINKIKTQKEIDLSGLNIDINTEVAKAVCDLPDDTQIDLSGNKIVKMDKKLLISLIYKIRKQKQIDMRGANIDIDGEIAKAVCDLPDETQIDLLGNKIVKMDKQLLTSLIYKIRKQKQIDLRGANIDIDGEIAKAVCDLPDETQIDVSGNKIVKMNTEILDSLILKLKMQNGTDKGRLKVLIDAEIGKAVYYLIEKSQIDLSSNKPIIMETKILLQLVTEIRTEVRSNLSMYNIHDTAELVIHVDDMIISWISTLSEDVQIDLSDNKITDESLIVSIIKQSSKLKSVTMRNCGIKINKQIAEAVSELNDDTKLDLSGNEITKMETGLLGKVLKYMIKQKRIDLSGLSINIDTELVKCISELPEDVQIDLSDNKITDESLIVSIIKQSSKLKSVTMRNCGIKINKQIAEAVSELNDDTKLDLSGNEITWMEAGLLGKVLKYMKKQNKVDIHLLGITIDVDIVKALSNMVHLKSLWLSGNTLTPSAFKCLVQSVRSLPQLEGLYLSRCGISNDDCVDLVSSLSKHCRRLEILDLCYNYLSSGHSQVVDDVRKMKNLRELKLSGNPCSWAGSAGRR